MDIQSRKVIEARAKKAAETRNDYCEYPYGSEHRAIWVDTYEAALDAKERAGAKMSEALRTAELV